MLITASLVGTVVWYARSLCTGTRGSGSAVIWLSHVAAGTEGLEDIGLPPLALIAAGLLALAWFERSRLVAVVACLVPAAAIVALVRRAA